MSLTQERINEIALECFEEEFGYGENTEMVKAAFNLFLSRIREEQEPYGYRIENHASIVFTRNKEIAENSGGFPLFTIPPASPDCKELVEALENKLRQIEKTAFDIDAPCIQVPIIMQRIIESREAITKHKAMMGEKE